MALVDTITRVQGKGNDIKRRLLMSPGQRCILLKRAGETKRYSVVEELLIGWNIRWSEFRNQFVLEVGYTEPDPTAPVFRDLISQTSHVAIGAPDYKVPLTSPLGYLDLYVTDPERRDLKPPTVDSPFWKVYLTRLGNERYLLTS